MHRPSSLSPDNILRFLQVTPNGANLEGILRGLRLKKSDRRPLVRILAKLKKKRLIEELPGGRFLLAGQTRKSEREAGSRSDKGGKRREERTDGARHGSSSRNSLAGRLILHQDGYGFVVPDRPVPNLDRDVFIPRDAVGDAMHGDHVQIEVGRISPGADGHRAEGRIVRILNRAHETVVGVFRFV